MKRLLPLIFGIVVGCFAVAEDFVPWWGAHWLGELFRDWAIVLSAAAFILGGVSVLQVNLPKIKRKEPDWEYKVVLLAGAAIMAMLGIAWHTFGEEPPTKVEVVKVEPGITAADKALVMVNASPDDAPAMIKIGPLPPQPVADASGPVELEVPPGKHAVRVNVRIAGYSQLEGEVEVPAGSRVTIGARPVALWGVSGRAYTWLYDHVFAPCNATMFSLLAFFVASAAFRAFRARNLEAGLLLGAAILVMIGRAPFGGWLSSVFPMISDWILEIPNNAGRRAIMMGAGIGAVATSLRIILGLERSHLGSE
jgi:hypothetical protein